LLNAIVVACANYRRFPYAGVEVAGPGRAAPDILVPILAGC
jgi:hypothetical protein